MGAGGGAAFGVLGSLGGAMLDYQAADSEYQQRKQMNFEEKQSLDKEIIERQRQLRVDLDVFKKQSKVEFGDNVSAFAKAGVDLSSSPLLVLGAQKAEQSNQRGEMLRSAVRDMNLLGERKKALDSDTVRARHEKEYRQFGSILGGAGGVAKNLPAGDSGKKSKKGAG